jgi:hypothetical protein
MAAALSGVLAEAVKAAWFYTESIRNSTRTTTKMKKLKPLRSRAADVRNRRRGIIDTPVARHILQAAGVPSLRQTLDIF